VSHYYFVSSSSIDKSLSSGITAGDKLSTATADARQQWNVPCLDGKSRVSARSALSFQLQGSFAIRLGTEKETMV
jgi:hypothetical protein